MELNCQKQGGKFCCSHRSHRNEQSKGLFHTATPSPLVLCLLSSSPITRLASEPSLRHAKDFKVTCIDGETGLGQSLVLHRVASVSSIVLSYELWNFLFLHFYPLASLVVPHTYFKAISYASRPAQLPWSCTQPTVALRDKRQLGDSG